MIADSFTFDTKCPFFIANPYPTYKKLRNEAPLYYSQKYNAWFISRYNDVKQVISNDVQFGFLSKFKGPQDLIPTWLETAENAIGFKGYLNLKNKVIESQNLWMVNRDIDDHNRIKKEFSPPFTANSLKLSEQWIRTHVINQLNKNKDKSEIDFIQDVSIPLTTKVFLYLLGVSDDKSAWILSHSLNLSKLFFLEKCVKEQEQGIAALINFMEFFRKEVKENADGDANKLISLLLDGKCEGRISMDELLANLSFFILAGVQSTIYFLGNLFYCLGQNPKQLIHLKSDHSLVKGTCEETLRFESVNTFTVRYTLEDVELNGQKISAGEKLILLIGSANRDEYIFHEADKFNINRDTNQHITFGFGNRYCIGSYLSRLEAKIILEVMLENFPKFSIIPNQQTNWYPNFKMRGLNSLKIKLY